MKKLQEYQQNQLMQSSKQAYNNQPEDSYSSNNQPINGNSQIRGKSAKGGRKIAYNQNQRLNLQQNAQQTTNGGANTSLGRINPSLLNIAPDNVKKRLLMNRLYDTGVSNIPLPSVERPLEKRASARPYSAKMGKKQKDPSSPVKKRLQDMNNSFNVNETYLTNHPGNFTNVLTNDQSFSYLKNDNSFADPYPRSRGIAGVGLTSGLNVSASDIQILQGSNPYINDMSGYSHGQLPSINQTQSLNPIRGKSAINLAPKIQMNQQTFSQSMIKIENAQNLKHMRNINIHRQSIIIILFKNFVLLQTYLYIILYQVLKLIQFFYLVPFFILNLQFNMSKQNVIYCKQQMK